MSEQTEKRLAWTFLACAAYLPLSLLMLPLIELSYRGQGGALTRMLNSLLLPFIIGLICTHLAAPACFVAALIGTRVRTLKRMQWWIGAIALICAWSWMILLLPKPAS